MYHWFRGPNRKGPSTQIVGLQGPKTIQSMDFGTQNPTIWVLGPSGKTTAQDLCQTRHPLERHPRTSNRSSERSLRDEGAMGGLGFRVCGMGEVFCGYTGFLLKDSM